MKKFLLTLLVIIFVVPLLFLIKPALYLADLPDTREVLKTNPQTSAIRTTREEEVRKKGGRPYSRMTWRNLNQISPILQQAVVLAEDDTFFQHNGFDIAQLKKAFWTNWERKSFAFGASTITQQLARTLYLSPHKSVLRKAKEALITRKLEADLPKERILELYLNTVEWGPQVYGAEAAAQYYFNRPASELDAEQAVALACILPSPRKWNPHKQTGFMGQRKSILTNRLVRARVIEAPQPMGPHPMPEGYEEVEGWPEDWPVDEIMPYGKAFNEPVEESNYK